MIYRRSEQQMPAEKKEIQAAKEEGINFLFQNNIVKIIGKDKIERVELIKTELVKKVGETREVPVNVKNSNYIINTDYVVMALGGKVHKETKKLDLVVEKNGKIKTDNKFKTSKSKIFAGGNLIEEKETVAWASHSGREAAKYIIEYIKR